MKPNYLALRVRALENENRLAPHRGEPQTHYGPSGLNKDEPSMPASRVTTLAERSSYDTAVVLARRHTLKLLNELGLDRLRRLDTELQFVLDTEYKAMMTAGERTP